jgi:hypothetical protein
MDAEPDAALADELDTTKPNIARVYDYWLGGKDNYAVDRQEGDRLLAINPDLRMLARQNRMFLAIAVQWLAAECGIRQFLDLGSGFPVAGGVINVHEAAQKVSPDCRVAYIDIDHVAAAHAEALLANSTTVQAIRGDLADPDAILADEKVRRVIDPDEPVAVILAMIPHFFPPDTVTRIVAEYADAIAAGSHIVISCGSGDDTLAREYRAGALYNHPREEIRRFFGRLELIDPPGLVDARAWRPGVIAASPSADGGHVLAGVARKPEAIT